MQPVCMPYSTSDGGAACVAQDPDPFCGLHPDDVVHYCSTSHVLGCGSAAGVSDLWHCLMPVLLSPGLALSQAVIVAVQP